MRILPIAILLAGLVGCSAKYQAHYFPPCYLAVPHSEFTLEEYNELNFAEADAPVSTDAKFRRLKLLQNELATLKKGQRYEWVKSQLAQLSTELGYNPRDFVDSWSAGDSTPAPSTPVVWREPELRRIYGLAVQLWNQDENEAALKEVSKLKSRMEALGVDDSEKRFKVLNLQSRLFMDLARYDEAGANLREMEKDFACAKEATELRFQLIALAIAKEKRDEAERLFLGLCAKSFSFYDRLRMAYWKTRLYPDSVEAALELSNIAPPGYYSYIQASRKGETTDLTEIWQATRGDEWPEITVPGSWTSPLSEVETKLAAKRHLEAFRQAMKMFSNQNPTETIPSLYLAHLFHATGFHLFSLKIYASILQSWEKLEPTGQNWFFGKLHEVYPRPYEEAVSLFAQKWSVSPSLMYSLMRQESAFQPTATSRTGAQGILQMMPYVSKDVGRMWSYPTNPKALYQVFENLKFTTFHLWQYQRQMPHPVLLITAYNAGLKRVQGWWKRWQGLPADVFVELIPVQETKDYVRLVLRNYLYYRSQVNNGRVEPFPFMIPPYTATSFPKVSGTAISKLP